MIRRKIFQPRMDADGHGSNLKSEIRILEIRKKTEIRIPKTTSHPRTEMYRAKHRVPRRFWPSGFGFLSDFGFRISDFELNPCSSPFIRGCFFFVLFVGQIFGQPPEAEPQTGEAIAQELRTMRPEENTEISGVLKIRSPNRREDIPVVFNVIADKNSWCVIYETRPTTNRPAEKLVVIHSLTCPNKYLYARAPTPSAALSEPKPLASSEAAIPFAGSDFWLNELGFDFLDWPEQNKLKGEMKLGRPCYVLESHNPRALKVVRVKSWIDKETGGVLVANAFDRDNKLVKEFSLGGSSFKKIKGHWQLKKMRISSPKNKSETVLEFDLPKD